MEKIQICEAGRQHEDKILEMANAFHNEDGHPLASTSAKTISSALQGNYLGKIYLVKSEEEVIGYFVLCFTLSIEFGGLVVILDDLYLDPEYRQNGIGGYLMNEIRGMAKGMNAVQLFLEVEDGNERARSFYLKSGFKIRERKIMDIVF